MTAARSLAFSAAVSNHHQPQSPNPQQPSPRQHPLARKRACRAYSPLEITMPNTHPDTQTDRIRTLNDELRKNIGAGRAFITAGVAALGTDAVARIVKTVEVFDDFCEANDPHQEHDFGSFEAEGHTIFFKIDAYDLSDDPTLAGPRRPDGDRARDHDHARQRVLRDRSCPNGRHFSAPQYQRRREQKPPHAPAAKEACLFSLGPPRSQSGRKALQERKSGAHGRRISRGIAFDLRQHDDAIIARRLSAILHAFAIPAGKRRSGSAPCYGASQRGPHLTTVIRRGVPCTIGAGVWRWSPSKSTT